MSTPVTPPARSAIKAHRQLMLFLMFAAIAYGWWQTTTPSRYAEMPVDPDPMGVLPVPHGTGSPLLTNLTHTSEEWMFQDEQVTLSVGWKSFDRRVRVFVRKSRPGAPLWKMEAILHDNYYVDEIVFYTNPEKKYRLVFGEDSVEIQSPNTPHQVLPFPSGAMFEDLICFQAMAWWGLRDTIHTQMIALVPDAIPIRSFPVSILPVNDTTLMMVGADSQQIQIVYDSSSPRVTHFCASAGLCADAHPPYENRQ